jgi:hypothetical protein
MRAGAVMRSTMHSDRRFEHDRYREKECLSKICGAMRLLRHVAMILFSCGCGDFIFLWMVTQLARALLVP